MAVLDITRAHGASANTFGAFIARLIGALTTWADTRATQKALMALSDYELEDIGLARGDIERIARR